MEIQQKSICKIVCSKGTGTGFLVTKDTILTARHVISEAILDQQKINISFLDNITHKYEASILTHNHDLDIAILKLEVQVSFKPLKVSKDPLVKDDAWSSFGFPGTGTGLLAGDVLKGTIKRSIPFHQDTIHDIDLYCKQFNPTFIYNGFSGSPIFDSNSNVTAILRVMLNKSLGAISIHKLYPFLLENITQFKIDYEKIDKSPFRFDSDVDAAASGYYSQNFEINPATVSNESESSNELKMIENKNKLNLYPRPKQYFSGRDEEIQIFKQAIDKGNNFIAIDGGGGIGKTQFITKCIEQHIPDEKVMWFDCKPESHFDTLITLAGYPELLEGSNKTNRDKFSAFKDKIQDNGYFLFLDNFQETNTKPIFKEFLLFIQDYLKKGCVITIDRDNITTVNLTPKRIHIESLKEKKLEYAKALIAHSYNDQISINDADLNKLCDELQGYPLAIDFAILLLNEGEKHTDIISSIVSAEGGEEISERLLNAIFTRTDATQEEKDFIKQFSVFNGSVHQEVVKAIISEKVMKVASRKLRRKNLISFSNGYYETHPLVKAFSYEKLEDKESMHKKVANYYIQTRTEELNPILEERIFHHLKLSKQWDLIEKEIEENGRKFILLGQLDLVQELIEKLEELKITNPIFNIFSGDIAEIQGNWNQAQKYYQLAKSHGENRIVKAEGMIKYAEILHRKGNVKAALPFYEEAYEYTKNIDSLKKENARAVNDIGLAYNAFGDTHTAFEKYNEALKIRMAIGDKEGIAISFGNIGSIYHTQGDLDKALEYQQKSLKIKEEIGNKQGIATSLGNIGSIYKTQGWLDKALEYQQKSLKIKEEIGNKQGIATSLGNIGSIYHTQGDLDKALEYQQKSLKIEKEIGNKQGIATLFGNIGSIYKTQGWLDKALEYQQKSLKIEKEIGNKQGIASSLGHIGAIYKTQKNLGKALEYHQKSLKIKKEVGDKQGIANSFVNIGAIYSNDRKKQYDLAINYFFAALSISNSIGAKPTSKTTRAWIASLRKKLEFKKFKNLALQEFKKLSPEMQKQIPMNELLNESIQVGKKIGRNAPCPCGSGKKYKKCHGK